MTKGTKRKINGLARQFYKSMGYEVNHDFDFSKSRHPQEYGVWNQALIALAYLDGDYDILKHQIGR